MNEFLLRASAVLSQIDELAAVSEEPDFICRKFGSAAFVAGSRKVETWMAEAGLQTHVDNIGNVRGKLLSGRAGVKTLVIASHIDTVINAGKFDGPLGVCIGLDLVKHLGNKKTSLPFNVELIAFSDEEGVRFHTTYLGSKVIAGTFENALLQRKDSEGISLQEAINAMGCDPAKICWDALGTDDWLGYFEVHIEQGPVLYEKKIPVALVKAIAGQVRVEVSFAGTSGHAGTVPMGMRNDALCCAAEFILQAENFGIAGRDTIVTTVGKLQITNPASNVIPGEVICSLDLRSDDEGILVSSHKQLQELCKAVCDRRQIGHRWNVIQQSKPVSCDKELNQELAVSIEEAGYECLSLVSGAGHDAVAISAVAPVSMMFVKCFEGISHNPRESVDIKDIAAAIQVCENFLHRLAVKYNNQ